MTLVIGERYRQKLESALEAQNVCFLWLPDNPDIDPRLAGHADLNVFSNNRIIISSRHARSVIINSLTFENALIEATPQGMTYPKDAGLCICDTGKYVIYNPKTVDPLASAHLDGTHVTVSQGYTKCSVCIVSNDAIITADNAVSSKASQAGMDVLKITPGYIKLDGYDYGFIGGASFLLNQNTLAFTGMLDEHPDKNRILNFLSAHHVEPVFLTRTPAFDIGGAVSLP